MTCQILNLDCIDAMRLFIPNGSVQTCVTSRAIGCELNADYLPLIDRRIAEVAA